MRLFGSERIEGIMNTLKIDEDYAIENKMLSSAIEGAQKKVEATYRDEKKWAKMALLNTACSGKFTSDRTIQEYVDDIWHLDKVIVKEN